LVSPFTVTSAYTGLPMRRMPGGNLLFGVTSDRLVVVVRFGGEGRRTSSFVTELVLSSLIFSEGTSLVGVFTCSIVGPTGVAGASTGSLTM